MPKLVITEDGGTREVGLRSGDTLGRTAQNAVQLKVAEASRRHCCFTHEKNAWFIEDLGSSNGTLVNGRRVTKFELQDGDVVQIGPVTLRFLDMEVEEGAGPEVEWGRDEISLEEEVFLVLNGAGREGEVVRIPEGRLTIGRNARHPLVLKHASVSGDHAEIVREGDRCTVRDLGSSNGTFVGDRRVEDAELRAGDVLRFGAIPCTFGVGDPADFAEVPPSQVDNESAEFTRVMEATGGLADDPSFELHDLPRQKEGVWNLVAVVMLLLLGAAAFFVMRWEPDAAAQSQGRMQKGSNLLPELAWSFELPSDEGGEPSPEEEAALEWDKEEAGDPVEVQLVTDPVRNGAFACLVDRREDAGGPSLVSLQSLLTVSSGSAYEISAHVTDATAIPVLALVWLDEMRDEEGRPLLDERGRSLYEPFAQDLVYGTGARDTWKELSGVVVAPDGAHRARVAVGIDGSGRAVFDDASLVFKEAPLGRVVDQGGFKATLGCQGTLRLSHYGRRIIDGLGLEFASGDEVLRQGALMVRNTSAPAGSVGGTLRGGRGDLLASLESGEDSLALLLAGSAIAQASSLDIPLVPHGSDSVQVTVLDGERGTRYVQPFEDVEGTALILGSGSDRVRLRLEQEETRLRISSSFALPRGGQPIVRVHLQGQDRVRLRFQLSFQKERQEARELLGRAQEAARRSKNGQAILFCEELMARFPFEETIEKDAAALRQRLMQEGRQRQDQLKQRLDDAIFFRELTLEKSLQDDLAKERATYAGTSLEKGFAELVDRHGEALAEWDQPLRQASAERAMRRASDYLEAGKKELALLFFRTIVARYDGTDEAEQAKAAIRAAGEGR